MHDVSCELSHDVVAVVTSKLLRYKFVHGSRA